MAAIPNPGDRLHGVEDAHRQGAVQRGAAQDRPGNLQMTSSDRNHFAKLKEFKRTAMIYACATVINS